KNPNGCIVDTRTKRQHEEEEAYFQNEFAKRIKTNNYQTRYAKSSAQLKDNEQDELSLNDVNNHFENNESDNIDKEYIDYFEDNGYSNIDNKFEDNGYDYFENNNEFLNNSDNIIDNNDSENNYSEDEMSMSSDSSEFYKEIEDLKSISVNPFQAPYIDFDKSIHIPELNINLDDLLWILIWVFKFQERFQLSNIVTDTLI
ncbi:5224_t:CDS:2, partial [Racocetra fulgida]